MKLVLPGSMRRDIRRAFLCKQIISVVCLVRLKRAICSATPNGRRWVVVQGGFDGVWQLTDRWEQSQGYIPRGYWREQQGLIQNRLITQHTQRLPEGPNRLFSSYTNNSLRTSRNIELL